MSTNHLRFGPNRVPLPTREGWIDLLLCLVAPSVVAGLVVACAALGRLVFGG